MARLHGLDAVAVAVVAAACAAALGVGVFIYVQARRGMCVFRLLHAPTLLVLCTAAAVHMAAVLLVAHRTVWPWVAHRALISPWLEFVVGLQMWIGVLTDRALIYGLIFRRQVRVVHRVDRLRVGVQILLAVPGAALATWGTFRGTDDARAWTVCVAMWMSLMFAERSAIIWWMRRRNIQHPIESLRDPLVQSAGGASGLLLPLVVVVLRSLAEGHESLLGNVVYRNALVLVVVSMHGWQLWRITWGPLHVVFCQNRAAYVEILRTVEYPSVYSALPGGNGASLGDRINAVIALVIQRAMAIPRSASESAATYAIERLCISMFLEWCSRLRPFDFDREAGALRDAAELDRMRAHIHDQRKRSGSGGTYHLPMPFAAGAQHHHAGGGGDDSAATARLLYAAAVEASPRVVVYPRRLAVAVDAIDARVFSCHSTYRRERARAIIRRFLTPPAGLMPPNARALNDSINDAGGDWVPLIDWRHVHVDSEYIEPTTSDEHRLAEECRNTASSERLDAANIFDKLRAVYLQRLYDHAAIAFSAHQTRVHAVWDRVRHELVDRLRRFGMLPEDEPAVWAILDGTSAEVRGRWFGAAASSSSPRGNDNNGGGGGVGAAERAMPQQLDMLLRSRDRSFAGPVDSSSARGRETLPRMISDLPDSLQDYRRFFCATLDDPALLEEVERYYHAGADSLSASETQNDAPPSPASGADDSDYDDDDDDDSDKDDNGKPHVIGNNNGAAGDDAEDWVAAAAMGLTAGAPFTSRATSATSTAESDGAVMQPVAGGGDMPAPKHIRRKGSLISQVRQSASFIAALRAKARRNHSDGEGGGGGTDAVQYEEVSLLAATPRGGAAPETSDTLHEQR